MRSPLLAKKSTMLPPPGGGVGGFDKSELYDNADPSDGGRDGWHAEPEKPDAEIDQGYGNPWAVKGTEPEQSKFGCRKAVEGGCKCLGFIQKDGDSSVCVCGHQWHEHHHEKAAGGLSEPSYRAAQILARHGRIDKKAIRVFAEKLDRMTGGEPAAVPKAACALDPVPLLRPRSGAKVAYDGDFAERLKMLHLAPDGYLFRSEVYCPRCGQEIIDELVRDRHIGPPGFLGSEDDSWLSDSDVVPQPLLSVEEGGDNCAKCGDFVGDAASGEPLSSEITDEDKAWLGDLGITAAAGLSSRLLGKPRLPDPETATFFKESDPEKPRCPHCGSDDYGLMPTDFETAKCNECGKNWNHGIVEGINDPGDSKTATEKSYGTNTPIGGGPGVPPQPKAHPWTPPSPPVPTHPLPQPQQPGMPAQQPQQPAPGQSPKQQAEQIADQATAPGMDRNVAQEVVKQLAEKAAGRKEAVGEQAVKMHESTDMLPPRTELRKHLDESEVDSSGNPPRPLSKGGALGSQAEAWWRRTPPAARREKAEAMGIEKYWSHFTWDSLPPEVREQAEAGLGRLGYTAGTVCPDCKNDLSELSHEGRARHERAHQRQKAKRTSRPERAGEEPAFSLTPEDRRLLGEMGVRAAKKADGAPGMLGQAMDLWKAVKKDPELRSALLGMAKQLAGPGAARGIEALLPQEEEEEPGIEDAMTLPAQPQKAFECPNCGSNKEPKAVDSSIAECADCGAWALNRPPKRAAGKDWDPLLARRMYDEGVEAARLGKVDEAIDALKKSVQHSPYRGQTHFMLGILLGQEGESEAAIQELERALRANPKENWAYHRMVKELQKEGDLEGLPEDVQGFIRENLVRPEEPERRPERPEAPARPVPVHPTFRMPPSTLGQRPTQPKPAQPAQPRPSPARVKMMVTKRDEVQLRWLGYTDEDIAKLKEDPQEAERLLEGGIRKGAALEGGKTAVLAEEPDTMACPNCKKTTVRPVDDPDAEGGNLLECLGCGAFFAR